MWVTQTYLGIVEPEAKVFVYYLYEDYVDDQKRFTEHLQRELERLGDVFGGQVSLLIPNPRYKGRIEAEVREIRPLWEALHDRLPGLLLSTKPLSQIKGYEEWCFFIPFAGRNRAAVAEAVQKIKGLADEAITWNYQDNAKSREPSFVERIGEAIEIKPGIAGFKIDLRRLFRQ